MPTRVFLCPIHPLSLCSLCRPCPLLSSSPAVASSAGKTTKNDPSTGRSALTVDERRSFAAPRPRPLSTRTTATASSASATPARECSGSGPVRAIRFCARKRARISLTPQASGFRRNRGRLPALGRLGGRRQRQCRCAFSPRLRGQQSRAHSHLVGAGVRPPGRGAHRPQQQRPLG